MSQEPSMSERGRVGGESAMPGGKLSAAQIAMYLKGVDFPADKNKIVQAAKSNNAPENVISFFNRLPDRQYGRPTEVEEEFNKFNK